MMMNFILRFAWTITLIPDQYFSQFVKETGGLFFFLSVAEGYRRAQWSLFRVENENVNNFEKYRIVLEIPKPLEENEDQSKSF